jgi:hypothetical protein
MTAWNGLNKDLRNLIVTVAAGLIVWAIPLAGAAVSPRIHALVAPIVALPWYVTLPSIVLIASGAINIWQSIAALRRKHELTAEAVVKPDPRWIEMDLRSIMPIALTRTAMTTQLLVNPRITNFGPVALRVTHLTVRASFGQIIQKLMLDTPFMVQPHASNTTVCLSVVPDKDTAEAIAEYVMAKADFNYIHLDVYIACESQAGSFEASAHIERQPKQLPPIII